MTKRKKHPIPKPKTLMLENAKINWVTDEAEMRKFMYHWCNGDSHKTMCEKLNRTDTELVLLMFHLEHEGYLTKRPNGIFGFENAPNREKISNKLFNYWNRKATEKEQKVRDEDDEIEESLIAT